MQKTDWSKIKNIFHESLDLPESERSCFLAGQTESVRSEVVRLLESHVKLDDFIAEPIACEMRLELYSYVGKTIGDYKVVELLGTGGMGQVFLAEKDGLEKKFALKIIKRGMDTDLIVKRFTRERRILERLQHRFIASLVDAGLTNEGLPFFVMEYIDGLPVTKFCDEHGFDIRERIELFRKICEAVSYAHQNLIIHRDLKPSNILIAVDGTPKLLDFGIAKLLDADLSENSTTSAVQTRMLTPEYASPEHLNGLPTSTATDVYSLGVVLFELLSGVRPFESRNRSYFDFANAISIEEPIRPSLFVGVGAIDDAAQTSSNRGEGATKGESGRKLLIANRRYLKGDLDNIILKALRKEPERRYLSVQELSEDIRHYMVGLPVTATADSAFYRFRKFVRRNKLSTVAAAFFLLLLGVSVWQTVEARRERSAANERFQQVRKLANLVLFEYQDEIGKFHGSRLVRERMVRDGAEYLDNLVSANSADPQLKSELGRAYDRLGDVKANFSRQSVANAIGAKEFYLKAMSVKQELMTSNPGDATFTEQIAISYDKLGDVEFGLGNQTAAVDYYQQAVRLREQILVAADRPETRFLLMKGYRNVAVRGRRNETTAENLALCQRALEMAEEFLRNAPENAEYQEAYGDTVEGIAAILETSTDRRPEAIAAYQNLIRIRGEHSAKAPNNSVLRQKFGMSYSYLGDTFFELQKTPAAIRSYRASLEILDDLSSRDKFNETLIQDTANVRSSYAYSLALTGNTRESLESFDSIIPVFEQKYAQDVSDTITHFRIAMAREGLALTYSNISKLNRTTSNAKITALENAISNFDQSLSIYTTYQKKKNAFSTVNVDVNAAVADVTAALADCRRRLAKLKNES